MFNVAKKRGMTFKIMGGFHCFTVQMLLTNLCPLRLDGWERFWLGERWRPIQEASEIRLGIQHERLMGACCYCKRTNVVWI